MRQHGAHQSPISQSHAGPWKILLPVVFSDERKYLLNISSTPFPMLSHQRADRGGKSERTSSVSSGSWYEFFSCCSPASLCLRARRPSRCSGMVSPDNISAAPALFSRPPLLSLGVCHLCVLCLYVARLVPNVISSLSFLRSSVLLYHVVALVSSCIDLSFLLSMVVTSLHPPCSSFSPVSVQENH